MKARFLIPALLLASGCVAEPQAIDTNEAAADPNVQQIEEAYMAYVQAYIDNDFEGIAAQFQVPVMRRSSSSNGVTPTRIAATVDELIESYKSDKANIQEGYEYSTIDRLDVHKIASNVYYTDVDFTRYNGQDEIIFEGRSLYYWGNDDGSWKMFAMGPAARGEG